MEKKKRTGLWVALAAVLLLAIGGIFYLKKKKEAEAPITAGNGSDGSPDTGINPMGGGGSSYTPPPPTGNPVQNTGASAGNGTGGIMVGSDGSPDTGINNTGGGGLTTTGGGSSNSHISYNTVHGNVASGAAGTPGAGSSPVLQHNSGSQVHNSGGVAIQL